MTPILPSHGFTPARPRRRRVAAALVSLALLASACGDDADDAGTDAATADRTADAESSFSPGATDDAGTVTAGDESAYEVDASSAESLRSTDGDAAPSAEFDEMDDDTENSFATSTTTAAAPGGLFDDEDDREREDDNTFTDYGVRPFVEADEDPLSTFALDVDTGSYTVARRWLAEGVMPAPASVRVEEFVNAFEYDYSPPRSGLSVSVDGAPSPFDDDNVLVRVAVQAAVVDDDDRKDAALTFVVDTSGSMDRDDRLGLVRESLEELVRELRDEDTVAIVTYGDESAVVLEPTEVRDERRILDAIDALRPGGSTNMEAGLRTGYELAQEAFSEGGINRVILASDGVANVGLTDPDGLTREITDRAINGIQLVTVGFGMGNFNDTLMEQLADQGDGFYAYVDTRDEAEELFENELVDNLTPIARDAKVQVEFDPDVVDEYRLIGFENRGVLDSDFRDDEVDAGELNSGHQATAIYEIDLRRNVDRDDLGTVTIRWEPAEGGAAIEIGTDIDVDDLDDDWRDTPADLRMATIVTAWAELLRDSPHTGLIDLEDVARAAAELDDELRTTQSAELEEVTQRSVDLLG